MTDTTAATHEHGGNSVEDHVDNTIAYEDLLLTFQTSLCKLVLQLSNASSYTQLIIVYCCQAYKLLCHSIVVKPSHQSKADYPPRAGSQ